MKILYISNFRDGTGYSVAATNYVLAMAEAGLDVVCRNIAFNNRNKLVDERVQALLDKDTKGCDICITHSLPPYFRYDGFFKKNIGLFAYETKGLQNTGWVNKINLMDEIWLISNFMDYEEIKIKKRIIPHAFNISKFNYSYSNSNNRGVAFKLKEETGNKIYYTIGEFVKRKNYSDLIKGYNLAFLENKKTSLIIKTSIPGLSPNEASNRIRDFIATVKRGMGIYSQESKYKEEIIITDYWSEEKIMQLHQEADTFVQTSYGEAFSIPAFTASAMGKTTIVPYSTGYLDYRTNETNYIKVRENYVYGVDDSIPGLYNSKQLWSQIDLLDFIAKLKLDAYKNHQSKINLELLEQFSFNQIGGKIKSALNE